jgi:penicillin-binding protein 1A
VGLDSLPKHVGDAFVAVEDKRFWKHGGVDWRRVLGALVSNVKAGGVAEGSSTITMQLARNVFPDKLPASERTLARKLGEARVAREIEKRYSKEEILELYLNQIYFGEGAYGIESAAQEYFGRSATQLTLAEAATLAALPRAPSRLNPRADAEAAKEGRRLVLVLMAEQGVITAAEREEALAAKLRLRRRSARSQDRAPYFVEAVRRQLEDQLGNAIYTEGYVIHTTLDLGAQRATENALTAQLRAIESGVYGSFPHETYALVQDTTRDAAAREGTEYLQGAVIVMEAASGDVLALIGGRDFDESQFNRATQALRQPGSAFKPFVYAAALQSGIPPTHRLLDQPLRMVIDRGKVWEPKNYDGGYSGVVSMREALTYSKNVATVRLASEVGVGEVLRLAENMGLGRMQPNPAVVLGTDEVTPIQLTAAFAAFATLGNRPAPRYVIRVADRAGQTVWAQQPNTERVIDPAVAYLTVSLLQDVVNRGTGTGVRAAGFRGPAGGKTGTTQDAADAWFVGITPQRHTVWIGLTAATHPARNNRRRAGSARVGPDHASHRRTFRRLANPRGHRAPHGHGHGSGGGRGVPGGQRRLRGVLPRRHCARNQLLGRPVPGLCRHAGRVQRFDLGRLRAAPRGGGELVGPAAQTGLRKGHAAARPGAARLTHRPAGHGGAPTGQCAAASRQYAPAAGHFAYAAGHTAGAAGYAAHAAGHAAHAAGHAAHADRHAAHAAGHAAHPARHPAHSAGHAAYAA